jgi:hypothetical protein
MDLSPMAGGLLSRAIRCKRWFYIFATAADADLAIAIVRTGYASKVFAFAWDNNEGGLYASASSLGPAAAVQVASSTIREGTIARARGLGVDLHVQYQGSTYAVEGRVGPLRIDLAARATAPVALTAVAQIGDVRTDRGADFYGATEKRALMPLTGTIGAAGKPSLRFRDGLFGYDLSHGVLPRRTRWRWAFALGRDAAGDPFAFNVVQGFIGAAECAVWTADGLFPLSEGVFRGPLDDETVRTEGAELDLHFHQEHAHIERTRLGLIESDFAQRLGAFRGHLALGQRRIDVQGLRGVTEDQAVLW